MKTYLYSMKLAAAFGLLVASVALAGPKEDVSTADPPDQPQAGYGILTVEPDAEAGQLDDGTDVQPPNIDRHILSPPEYSAPRHGQMPDLGVLTKVERHVVPNPFWIGVQSRRLPDALRNHLGIPAGQGVLVVVVVPEAPAAKAGILENDILLTGNKKPLKSVADLSRLVAEIKDQPITFDLIRKGQRMTIDVTPAQNPLSQRLDDKYVVEKSMSPEELERFHRWLQRQHMGRNRRPRMRLQFMNPGVILPADALIHPALPGGMSITIMKKGDEPTQITVTRDDDVWKVDEKNLDKLPEDIRPSVERMLNGLVISPEAVGPRFDYMPELFAPKQMPSPAELEAAARGRMQKQMERMNRRLEELHKMIEGMRDKKGPEEKK